MSIEKTVLDPRSLETTDLETAGSEAGWLVAWTWIGWWFAAVISHTRRSGRSADALLPKIADCEIPWPLAAYGGDLDFSRLKQPGDPTG